MKTLKEESVLYDWVHKLPFQMQALLMTGVRGPDGSLKHNTAKALIRYLPGAIIKPAGDWSGRNDNDWCWGEEDKFAGYAKDFFHDHDSYPHHFIMHLVHCAQVIGHYHPQNATAHNWNWFYIKACKEFHMTPETKGQMEDRLNDFGCGITNWEV